MNTPFSLPNSFAPVWVLISLRFFPFLPKTKPLYCSGISTSSPDETSSAFKFLSWTACCKKVHFFTGNINATGRFKVYSVMHPRCYNNWWNKSGCYMRDSTFSCHLPLKSVLINMAESLSSKTTETKRSPKTTVIVEIKKIRPLLANSHTSVSILKAAKVLRPGLLCFLPANTQRING